MHDIVKILVGFSLCCQSSVIRPCPWVHLNKTKWMHLPHGLGMNPENIQQILGLQVLAGTNDCMLSAMLQVGSGLLQDK